MKANEYIKLVGLDEAKENIKDYNPEKLQFIGVKNLNCDFDDLILKSAVVRMVRSHEIVAEHCTLQRAKEYAKSPYTAPEIKELLEKAIADVESCQ